MKATLATKINATQTIATFERTGDAEAVAARVNGQPKPCRVWVTSNEIRPVAIQSRASFIALHSIVKSVLNA